MRQFLVEDKIMALGRKKVEEEEDISDIKKGTAKLMGDLRRIHAEVSWLKYGLGISASCKHLLTPEINAVPEDIMKILAKLETLHAKINSLDT